MLKRFASGLAIWTLAAATGLAVQELTPAAPAVTPAPQAPAAPAVRDTPANDAPVPEPIREMQALHRHARTGMICYTGTFGGPAKKEAMPALALNFKLQPPRK